MKAKVAMGVALPLFVVLSALSYIHATREDRLIREQGKLYAARLGEMLSEGLRYGLIANDDAFLQSVVESVGRQENVDKILLVGLSGNVLASSDEQTSVQGFSQKDLECQACHQYSPEDRPDVIYVQRSTPGWQIATPLDNDPECQVCHTETASHLGMLLLDISLTDRQAHLEDDLRLGLAYSLLGALLISLVSYYLIKVLIVHRMENLKMPLQSLGAGDYSVRIEDQTSLEDELTDLIATINQMVEELEESQKARERIQKVRETAILEERERIGRDLHDGLAQILGFIKTRV